MKLPLAGGTYQARALIAGAQRCVNLYPEKNQEGASFPFTYYPTPGLVPFAVDATNEAPVRGIFKASNNNVYAVIGRQIYSLASDGTLTPLINMATDISTPVSFDDNTFEAVIVEGTDFGYVVNMSDGSLSTISSATDAGFYGGTSVAYVDSFLLFNRPGTRQWYTTLSNQLLPFDATYFALKTAGPDPLLNIAVLNRSILLFGEKTVEFWYNAGGSSFPFAIQAGAFVNVGLAATYSVAQNADSVFWLGRNDLGEAIATMTVEYDARRISTYALEAEWASYSTVEDATAFTYQDAGHVFYVLNFPTADKTWVFDVQEGLWHQRAWMDTSGGLHRHRANCHCFAFGKHLVGDFENGQIYELTETAFDDDGDPVFRARGFPTLSNESRRVAYTRFLAELEVGASEGLVIGQGPKIFLRWSDDYGQTWSTPVGQSVGASAQYLTSVVWSRLGMGRNRVFELSWSWPYKTALSGAYLEATPAAT